MAKRKATDETVEQTENRVEASTGQTELAHALIQAIEATKPPTKKNQFNRKKNTPWTPKDGSPRLKLKRKMYHHSLPLENKITNEEIALLNKIRPGSYCDGFVKVVRRRDRGLDIDYKIKTASDRLKLVNQFGIRNFKELLERLVNEGENPVQFKAADDWDS